MLYCTELATTVNPDYALVAMSMSHCKQYTERISPFVTRAVYNSYIAVLLAVSAYVVLMTCCVLSLSLSLSVFEIA